jgi:2-desacetyl-2-hydroxyethyl bacteriochlorophyllide A dehydrogenase
MHAAFVERTGPPEIIRYGPLPDPVPGPTDVLVEVRYTTVNPVDTFIRSGRYPVPMPLPFVVGRDLVGRVVAAGPGAPGFAVGDPVWCNSLGHGGRQGAAAQLAVVPADRLYHLPPGADPAAAVTVLHPAATAYLALFTHGQLRPGETVLVAGAAGNVGSALVTMAADAGATVVATARPDDAGYCRDLGAARVLDYSDGELAQRLARACPAGADLYLDTSGRNDLELALGVLAERGRIVLLAGMRARPVLPAAAVYLSTASIRGFVISRSTTAELDAAAAAVNRLLAAGRLRSREVRRYPLRETARVHERMERGELTHRRVVLEVPPRS